MMIRNARHAFVAGALALFGSAQAATTFNPADTSAQMFHWRWPDIATECTQWLGPNGYGGVQVSPPESSAKLGHWYDMYQPVNYTVLNSNMGTEAQFQSMINTCHAAHVRVYADVVANHMAGGSGTATDGSPWNSATLTYPYFSAADFHTACDIQSSDYSNNRHNVIFCRLAGMPDLMTDGSYVRGQITNYLTKLLNMGVDGFRFDAAKWMQPVDLQAFMNGIAKTTAAGEKIWVAQEVSEDGTVVRSDYFPSGTINEFLYTGLMQSMFRKLNGTSISQIQAYMGTPGNWGGTWGFVDSSHATVFVNNWDTERDGASLVASNFVAGVTNDTNGTKAYDLANILMLAWPYGNVQVHSGFRFTDVNQDAPSASPYSGGNPQINVNWDFIHRWGDISNMVAFRSATSGQGVGYFTQGTAHQIAFSRGAKGFVAINNDTVAWNATLQTGLPAGTYCNVVHGLLNASKTGCFSDSIVVSSKGTVTVSIPANNGSSVTAIALYVGQKL